MSDLIAIQASELSSLINEIREIKATISQNQEAVRKHIYLTSEQVCEKYQISQRTLQSYRDRRLIPFTQLGQKIWYCQADLDNFFSSHKIE